MPYISTRDGRAPPLRLPFEDVLVAGLAPDGGLYRARGVAAARAARSRRSRGKSYAEIAAAVIEPFLDGA